MRAKTEERARSWAEGPESGAHADSARGASDSVPPASTRGGMSGFDEIAMPVADPLIGVVVAERYRILEGLGRGGMGIVYKVEHVRIGKLLAMKLLTGELSRNPDVVRRFKHEALTASKLSSPNTVQVFDFGVSDGLTYLVMELVAGEDLGRMLRTLGPMPLARFARIIVQVCTSLAEAHQKQIVHRDVKPENIMIVRARDGTDIAKVLDFGLAKLREGPELLDVTSQGAIVGTPYFMSPEQIRGEPVDARSDIYALGALMYRALTGHFPFTGPTPMAVFTKHLTEPPVPPDARAPDLVARSVSDVLLKCLAKAPADRFQRVEDLQTALIQEIRRLGTASGDAMLDSGALRTLARTASESPDASIAGTAAEIATRDEVEAYERKLRRQRYGAVAVAAAVAAASVAFAARFVMSRAPEFAGLELEPNNAAADATVVPVGRTATGWLGKRLDATHSDRDFYAFEAERSAPGDPSLVRLTVGSLPNMPMCALLYRAGEPSALSQYCVGRAGRDLEVGALRLEPGRYLVAIMQDLDPYGGVAPPVHENISDAYAFLVEQTSADPSAEIEPDDQVASANLVAPGESMTGALAWARDEDIYCVPPDAQAPIRWRVSDVVRDGGAVLEVTPMRGGQEGAPVRVHVGGKQPQTATDVLSPWTGPSVAVDDGSPRCLRARLVYDPWTSERSTVVPSGGSERYRVEVLGPQ